MISGVEIGFNQKNYLRDKANETKSALIISDAKNLSPKGIIGLIS